MFDYLGMDEFDSFNALSENEKERVIEQIIDDSIRIMRNREAGILNESYESITPAYDEFENLSQNEKIYKVEKYISECLGG